MGMFSNPIAILCICIVAKVKTKNLHIKETEKTDLDDDVKLQDIINYDDPLYYTAQDRFARHVELVTESVLDHLLKEMNRKFSQKNDTSLPKMMQRLKMKLRNHINKKKRLKKKSHKYDNSTTSNRGSQQS